MKGSKMMGKGAAQDEIDVNMSPEIQLEISKMHQRVQAKIQHMEGVKTAVVMYILKAYGKNINKRQMKRVCRVVNNEIPDVVTREFFLYDKGNGVTDRLCTFDTVTPVSGKFELRFESGLTLTDKQREDVEKLLNYEHPGNVD